MNCVSGDSLLEKNLHYFVRSMLGSREDKDCLDIFIFKEMKEKMIFVRFIHMIDTLIDDLNS